MEIDAKRSTSRELIGRERTNFQAKNAIAFACKAGVSVISHCQRSERRATARKCARVRPCPSAAWNSRRDSSRFPSPLHLVTPMPTRGRCTYRGVTCNRTLQETDRVYRIFFTTEKHIHPSTLRTIEVFFQSNFLIQVVAKISNGQFLFFFSFSVGEEGTFTFSLERKNRVRKCVRLYCFRDRCASFLERIDGIYCFSESQRAR